MKVASIVVFGTKQEMGELRWQLENQCIQTVDYTCVRCDAAEYDPATHIAQEIKPYEGSNSGVLHPDFLELLVG